MKTNIIIGAVLILLGILFLGPSLGLFTLAIIWPGILLLLGIGFFAGFFAAPKIYGLLMPGSILVISSIPFFMCTLSGDWLQMARLWPLFLLSVSVGFLLMYFVGNREKGLLIPAFILLGVGTLAFLLFNYINFIFPIGFIAGGLIVIFVGLGTGRKKAKLEQSEPTLDPVSPASKSE
jgi:hypothetical protein